MLLAVVVFIVTDVAEAEEAVGRQWRGEEGFLEDTRLKGGQTMYCKCGEGGGGRCSEAAGTVNDLYYTVCVKKEGEKGGELPTNVCKRVLRSKWVSSARKERVMR